MVHETESDDAMDEILVTACAAGAVPGDRALVLARDHVIARTPAPAGRTGERLPDRNAGLSHLVPFRDVENEVDCETDGQWRVRKKLIERSW